MSEITKISSYLFSTVHKAINNARSPISNTQSILKSDITPFQKHVCIDTAR